MGTPSSESTFDKHKRRLFRLKDHPFIVPVITLIILVAVTLVSIVVFNATTIGPADSHVVSVFVDDEQRTLPTRARTVGELLEKLNITIKKGDVVEPSADTPIYEDDFEVNVYRSREVVIYDGKKTVNIKTASRSPRIIARNAGIVVYPEDNIVPKSPDDVLEEGFNEQYAIKRATPVTLILYGRLIPVRTQAKTVGELLEEKNIQVSVGDTVKPDAGTPLSKSSKIVITRPGQTIATKEESIPPPVDYVDDPNLLQGVEEVREPGQPGQRIVTYDIQKKNGKEVSRKKIQEIIAVQPVARVVAVGTKSKLIGSSNAELLRLLRECETGANYQTNTGNGYYGAYQFSAATWFSITPYPSLPHEAPSTVQDDAALRLAYRSGFHSQFPGCSSKIGLPAYPN